MSDMVSVPAPCLCGCGQTPKKKDWMPGHQNRYEARPAAERFWEKVTKTESGCWEWTGGRAWGYGLFSPVMGQSIRAHRFSYEQHKGPIPEGLTIDHLCRNRACVNPDHLEAVTQAENNRRSPYNLGALNALKTECKSGHPLSGDNLYVTPNGRRQCRTCRRESNRQTQRKRRAQNV